MYSRLSANTVGAIAFVCGGVVVHNGGNEETTFLIAYIHGLRLLF